MPINDWAALCVAVGIPARELDLMDTYLASGAIIHSRTLHPYLLKYITNNVLPPGARLRALYHDVTPEDLASIRAEAYKAILPKLKGKS